jgi:hypothetical protein
VPDYVKSAYLGQFTDEVANMIAGELEGAKIAWSYKQAGWITRIFFLGEWGTRLFVDAERLDEAKRIAERVVERTKEA